MRRAAAVIVAAVAACACGEIPQDAAKSYAGKADTQPYSSDTFKGDKAKYEAALAKRANYQNEYVRSTWAK